MTLTLYSKDDCVYCDIMRERLTEWGVEFEEVKVPEVPEAKEMFRRLGLKTVPQLFCGEHHLNASINTGDMTKDLLAQKMREVSGRSD